LFVDGPERSAVVLPCAALRSQGIDESGLPDCAYYLAGYSVECALKACIAKATQRYEFPEKKRVNASHTHDVGELVKVAELQDELLAAAKADPLFRKHWNDVQEWSEQSRYDKHSVQGARALIEAVGDRNHGVLKWAKLY
jgi:hypothetical protein